MKKMVKKVSALFAGILAMGVFAACAGEKFDASAYLTAILDNSYYNNPTAIVEQEIGTEEEANAIYEQGIDAQMEAMLTGVTISDELSKEYRQFYKDLYSSVKYTVGEATEVDENTIEVTVTYEKMNVFDKAMVTYTAKVDELAAAWTQAALNNEEVPSDEAMNEEIFAVLKECMSAALAEASYDAPATLKIRVELADNVWTPNQEDLLKLEYALFDFEGLYDMQ